MARFGYEYRRCSVCSVFVANEPPAELRMVKVFPTRTKVQWAHFFKHIADKWSNAERITLVMDNLNAHSSEALYEAFPPHQAKQLQDRFEFEFTPKHVSWMNMAEIELQVLSKQCLNRHIDSIEEIERESTAWEQPRNKTFKMINWQFTTEGARIKLHRHYPTFED